MTTETQCVAAARPQRRRIVGYHPGLSVFAAIVVLGVFVFSWVELAAPPNDGSNIPGALVGLCIMATGMCLLGTCRLVVDPAGFIDVVGLFVVRRVPVSELVAVEHEEGLHLRVVSGRRIGSIAYGRSLLGELVHYPRSVSAARRIQGAVGGLRAAEWPLPEDTVRTHLRIRAYLGTLAVNAVLVLGTVLLNLAQTAGQQ